MLTDGHALQRKAAKGYVRLELLAAARSLSRPLLRHFLPPTLEAHHHHPSHPTHPTRHPSPCLHPRPTEIVLASRGRGLDMQWFGGAGRPLPEASPSTSNHHASPTHTHGAACNVPPTLPVQCALGQKTFPNPTRISHQPRAARSAAEPPLSPSPPDPLTPIPSSNTHTGVAPQAPGRHQQQQHDPRPAAAAAAAAAAATMLEYDDSAFYYFCMTLLSFYMLPGTYYLVVKQLLPALIPRSDPTLVARTEAERRKAKQLKEEAKSSNKLLSCGVLTNAVLLFLTYALFIYLVMRVWNDAVRPSSFSLLPPPSTHPPTSSSYLHRKSPSSTHTPSWKSPRTPRTAPFARPIAPCPSSGTRTKTWATSTPSR